MTDLVKLVHFTKEGSEAHRGNLLLVYRGMKCSPCPGSSVLAPAPDDHGSRFSLQSTNPHLLVLTLGWPRTPLLSFPVCDATPEQLLLSVPTQGWCSALGSFSVGLANSTAIIPPVGPMQSLFLGAIWDNQKKIHCSDLHFKLDFWVQSKTIVLKIGFTERIYLLTHRDNDNEIVLHLYPENAKHFMPSYLIYFFTKTFFFLCKFYSSFQEAKFSSTLIASQTCPSRINWPLPVFL